MRHATLLTAISIWQFRSNNFLSVSSRLQKSQLDHTQVRGKVNCCGHVGITTLLSDLIIHQLAEHSVSWWHINFESPAMDVWLAAANKGKPCWLFLRALKFCSELYPLIQWILDVFKYLRTRNWLRYIWNWKYLKLLLFSVLYLSHTINWIYWTNLLFKVSSHKFI